MLRRIATLLACALLFSACGKDDASKDPAGGTDQTSKAGGGGGGAKPKEPAKPKIDIVALTRQKHELSVKLKDLKAGQKEMEARHKSEAAALPPADELRDLRRRFSEMKGAAIRSGIKMQRMEKRMAELKKLADSSAAKDLQGLYKQQAAIEKRLKDANAVWSKAR